MSGYLCTAPLDWGEYIRNKTDTIYTPLRERRQLLQAPARTGPPPEGSLDMSGNVCVGEINKPRYTKDRIAVVGSMPRMTAGTKLAVMYDETNYEEESDQEGAGAKGDGAEGTGKSSTGNQEGVPVDQILERKPGDQASSSRSTSRSNEEVQPNMPRGAET